MCAWTWPTATLNTLLNLWRMCGNASLNTPSWYVCYPLVGPFLSFLHSFLPLYFVITVPFSSTAFPSPLNHVTWWLSTIPRFRCLFTGQWCFLWPLIHGLVNPVPDVTHQTTMEHLCIVHISGTNTLPKDIDRHYSLILKGLYQMQFYFFTSSGEWWQGLVFFTALWGLSVLFIKSKYNWVGGYLAYITMSSHFPWSQRGFMT